jgi:HEPN domain-containing protein
MMDEYLQKWLIKADNDLIVAEHEMNANSEERVTDAVCFHCQQAVEKYLKAFLIFRKKDFGKTHNLEYLLKLCSQLDKEFTKIDVGNLSFYAVEIRYPDDFYIPTVKEAKDSVKIAKQVKKFVLKRIQS